MTALDEEKVLAALGNKLRWRIFRMLAGGAPMNAAAVARAFDRDFDGISKHLRILRSAGLLQSKSAAADRRVTYYFVSSELRQTAGEIELGFCLLRVPEARPDSSEKPVQEIEESADLEPNDQEPPAQGFGEMLAKSAKIGVGQKD